MGVNQDVKTKVDEKTILISGGNYDIIYSKSSLMGLSAVTHKAKYEN